VTISSIYLDVVSPLTAGFRELVECYGRFDTRVHNLRAFENVLSPALPMPLHDVEEYKTALDSFPLPADENRYLTPRAFRGYISCYDVIMRAFGMSGPEKKETITEDSDPLGAYLGGGAGAKR